MTWLAGSVPFSLGERIRHFPKKLPSRSLLLKEKEKQKK